VLPDGVIDAATLRQGLPTRQVNPNAGIRTYSAPVAIGGKHDPSNYRAAPVLPAWQFAVSDPTAGVLGFECEPAPANGWHAFARNGSGHRPVLLTGGSGAAKNRVYTVYDKDQLLQAVNEARDEPKIIRIVGHIDFRWDRGSFREYTSFDDQKQGGSLQIPSNTTLVGIDVNSAPARLTGTQVLIGAELALAAGGDPEADFKAWVAAGKDPEEYPTWTRNVIIRNLRIDTPWDVNPEDSANAYMDGVTLSRAQQVWIDHVSVEDGDTPDSLTGDTRHDGGLDIVRGSDYVTVSASRFAKHHKLTLVGNGDSGRAWSDAGRLHVTFTGNWWDSIGSRQPLVRFGQVHLYNNLISGSTTTTNPDLKFGSALDVRYQSDVISESNFYDFSGLKPVEACGKLAGGKSAVSFRSSGQRFVSDRGDDGKPMPAIVSIELQGCEGLPVKQLWTPPYGYSLVPADGLRSGIRTTAGPGRLSN
jgi:pectate lyase